MIPGSRRLGCAGYSWKSLAITWQTLFLRVGGWRKYGRILASLSSIENGCMMLMCLHHMGCMMEVGGGSKILCCFAWESKGRFSLTLCMTLQEEGMALSPWYLMIIGKHFHLGKYSTFVVGLLEESLTRSMSKNIVVYWQDLIFISSQRCHLRVKTYGWSVPIRDMVDP